MAANNFFPGIHNWTMRLLLAILLAAWAVVMVIAQQQYSPQGYNCNGRDTPCASFAFYRTSKEQESIAQVAAYFSAAPITVADASGLSNLRPDAALPMGQALYIPLNCSCHQRNNAAEMLAQVPYTIRADDTFALLAATTYGFLTTYAAMEVWNPSMDVYKLVIGATMVVPIFCACPSADQTINDGTKFLLTYGVYPNETLDAVSGRFGITAAQLSDANEIAVNATLEDYTTLLVPLKSLPPISAMDTPNVVLSPDNIVSPNSKSSRRRDVGAVAAGAAVVLVVGLLFIARYRRRVASSKKLLEKISHGFSLVDQNLFLRMFTYKELCKATKNFRRSEILGSGGFGAVYKGTLPSGELVAVKLMRMKSKQGQESFRAEVTSLGHIRHRNLVQLRGWCHEEEELLLVYDYICNGSLAEWLFQFSECCEVYGKGRPCDIRDAGALPLKLRHSVLSGVACALSYLHEECTQCVLHRDIKSSNVLLDGEFRAYLGDFGLARLIDHRKMARTTMMAGTLGYLAPEMPHTGKATKETDVYSFGILMLEVMCGKEPLDVQAIEQGEGVLEDRVWRAHEAGNILQVADSRLGTSPISAANSGSFGGIKSPETEVESSSEMYDIELSGLHIPDAGMEDRKMITNLLHLGLLCCNPRPEDRPSMRLVSQLMLQSAEEMEMSMPCLPEWKPQVHYSRSGIHGFSQFVE